MGKFLTSCVVRVDQKRARNGSSVRSTVGQGAHVDEKAQVRHGPHLEAGILLAPLLASSRCQAGARWIHHQHLGTPSIRSKSPQNFLRSSKLATCHEGMRHPSIMMASRLRRRLRRLTPAECSRGSSAERGAKLTFAPELKLHFSPRFCNPVIARQRIQGKLSNRHYP